MKKISNINFNKSGSGSINARVIIPVDWLKNLNITQNDREVVLEMVNDKIVISKNGTLLDTASRLIENEMKEHGFIDDSDNTDRFIDNLAHKLAEREILNGNTDIDFYYEKEDEIEELQEKLCEDIRKNIMEKKYKHFSNFKADGNVDFYYYNVDKEFDSIEKFNNYFGIER